MIPLENVPRLLVDSLVVFFSLCLGLGLLLEGLGALSMIRFYFKKAPPLPKLDRFPGVTMIKPCYGIHDHEEENFDTFFHQDYPGPIELLFVVSDVSDPVVPVIQNYLKKYPDADAQLVISKTRDSFRRKVDALYDGHAIAKHEVIVWSDSDAVVGPEYFRENVASLLQPGTAIVSIPQYEFGVSSFTSAVKVLSNNCDVGLYISIADWAVHPKKYAWGHSLAFKRSDYEEHRAEVWDVMNRFLADDQSLPYLFSKYGKTTVLRNIYCPVHCGEKSWSQMIDQKKRWAVCQRLPFPSRYLYLSMLLIYPQINALFLVLLSSFDSFYVGLFFLVAAIKVLLSFQFEFLFLRSWKMTAKYFAAICLADLLQIYFAFHAFFTHVITFHGKAYRVVDRYFLEEVKPGEGETPESLMKWLKNGLRSVFSLR